MQKKHISHHIFFLPMLILLIIAEPALAHFNTDSIENSWVDSVMSQMSLQQKVAQLIMPAVYSNKDEAYNNKTIEQFCKNQYGGIIYMQGDPVNQILLNNRLQSALKIPAMVALDAEYGLGMRLKETIRFPRNMVLGAIQDNQLIFDFGAELARQCKRVGVHINFAPVIDVNVNAENPIIGSRSYGENVDSVVTKSIAFTQGLQSEHVMAVAKHFPGHGDTNTDSHLATPIISHSRQRLDSIELTPFRKLINNELNGIMVAHLTVPALEADSTPATLSARISDTLLQQQLGFNGLVFTDGLNMRGVTNRFSQKEIGIKALNAGADILLFPENAENMLNGIIESIETGAIDTNIINQKCRKVLKAKYWFGLNSYTEIDTCNVLSDLNNNYAKLLNRRIIESGLTLIQKQDVLPIKTLKDNKILSIAISETVTAENEFQKQLSLYAQVDHIQVSIFATDSAIAKIVDTAKQYNTVIICTLGTNEIAKSNYGLVPESIKLIDTLATCYNPILVHLGNPYGLAKLAHCNLFKSILIGYRADEITQNIAAQAVFGGVIACGKLPVSINSHLKLGMGESQTTTPIRLKYTTPDELNLPIQPFEKIDSIINWCITNNVMPGCQILLAAKGNVIYHKAYGHHTYTDSTKVKLTDIYDIASVTKVAATTTALMQLYDNNQFSLKQRLSAYVPELKNSQLKEVKINSIMAHQAGLKSWLRLYQATLDKNGNLRPELFATHDSAEFSIQLTPNLFMRSDYVDTAFFRLKNEPLSNEGKYRYSDIGFYMLPKLIENQTKLKINDYCKLNIYEPMGMNNTSYLPLQKFDTLRIVPSEIDNVFRKTEIRGFVNDAGAAMVGGISGHAGLFSNANDLAKLGQMLLNNGQYANKQYINASTIKLFTTKAFAKSENRRALGFDKPLEVYNINGPTCELASQQSYGHTGFTGAYLWIDPKNQSVMVFVTNRTYPDPNNNKLAKLNIRTDIQALFYQALLQNTNGLK